MLETSVDLTAKIASHAASGQKFQGAQPCPPNSGALTMGLYWRFTGSCDARCQALRLSGLPFTGCMQVLSRKLFLPYRHREYGLYFCVESITCMYVPAASLKNIFEVLLI